MIAADTSTIVAFNAGANGRDIDRFIETLDAGLLVLPPTVLAELLSDPQLPSRIEERLLRIPQLVLTEGYWERVGHFRRGFLKMGIKCRLADAQIAQACIDAKVSLIARDQDFKKYVGISGLKLFLGP